MPAEFLRDICRAPDGARRTRRLSVLPLSIAAHAAAALAVVIIPLAAENELPTPAALPGPAFVKAQPLPPPPAAIPNNPARVVSPAAAPVVAPETIAPERPAEVVPPTQPGVPVEGGLPSSGNGVIGGVGAMIESPPLPPPPTQVPSLVKVGGSVREPKRIVDVAPVYPIIARNNRVEGLVMLEAVINEAGVVERIKVQKSVPLLDDAAIEAVRQWRYTPTLLNGSPVSVLMTISVRFTIN
jgi:protein TonB